MTDGDADGPAVLMTATPLDYAGAHAIRPPSNKLWLTDVWMSLIAGVVGVGVLLLYALTSARFLPELGFFWLLGGGALTGIAFVLGAIYALTAMLRRFPPPASKGRAIRALLLPILNVPVAIGCAYAGLWLMDYNALRLIIRNTGTTQIDSIRLASPSFSRTVGPLRPGRTIAVRYPRLPSETMTMEVQIGDQRVPYVVTDSMTAGSTHGPRHIDLSGLTGYRNYLRQGS